MFNMQLTLTVYFQVRMSPSEQSLKWSTETLHGDLETPPMPDIFEENVSGEYDWSSEVQSQICDV